MYRGYIKLWRKIFDSGMHRNHKLFTLWVWLLTNVTHKEIECYAGLKKIRLLPGQIITGRKHLAKKLFVSEQSVRTLLNSLQTTGNLTIKSTNKYSIITVVNWACYQSDEDKLTSKSTSIQPATNQQLTTKQEHKNVKNKNIYTSAFEKFWSVYPKRVGKGAAFRAWQKAKDKPPLDKLEKIIIQQSKSDQWQKDNGQFIPNPATWLNQRRWEDDIKINTYNPVYKTAEQEMEERWMNK